MCICRHSFLTLKQSPHRHLFFLATHCYVVYNIVNCQLMVFWQEGHYRPINHSCRTPNLGLYTLLFCNFFIFKALYPFILHYTLCVEAYLCIFMHLQYYKYITLQFEHILGHICIHFCIFIHIFMHIYPAGIAQLLDLQTIM